MTPRRFVLRCAFPVCALAGTACGPSPVVTPVTMGGDPPYPPAQPVAPSPAPTAFSVRLHRPQQPGDRGMISKVVRTRRTTVVTDGDSIVRREDVDREVDLEAIQEVLRVDAAGTPVGLAYTIQHLVVETPGGRTEVLPGGWVVSAERGGRAPTLRSAEPLPAEARKALDDILSPLPSESSDDQIFGTDEPRVVGAVWPVNTALAARELGAMSLDVPAGAVRGQSRLVGLVEVGGQVCLEVRGELTIRDTGLLNVPGARPEAAELRSTYTTRVPVDAAMPEIDSTLRVEMDVAARVALGPDREGRLSTTSWQETRRRYMPLR